MKQTFIVTIDSVDKITPKEVAECLKNTVGDHSLLSFGHYSFRVTATEENKIIMNKDLNLCEILKDCPAGTKLWSPVWGNVVLQEVNSHCAPIVIRLPNGHYDIPLYSDGRLFDGLEESECILFPSKNQRDWSKFKAPIKRFDPINFKPFDIVLMRKGNEFEWTPNFFGQFAKNSIGGLLVFDMGNNDTWSMCIPYNTETQHLLGTREECPDYYKWWENVETKIVEIRTTNGDAKYI